MSRLARADEPAAARIARRAVTIPAYALLGCTALVALPLLLPPLALHDALRRNRWSGVRCALALAHYAVGELLGLVAAALLVPAGWLFPARALDWNFRLQWAWARWLFAGAARIFGLRVSVRGLDAAERGPVLLFLRHASVIDTLLPAAVVSSRTGLRLRYVMKRELLWDPCLDVVGQRLPNAFVRRGRGGAEAEIARVRELAADLGPRDGVLLYPEGTRYTPQRRREVLARLAETADPKHLERARALQQVLPPRFGGVLALLDDAPGVDVVVCAHTGFEDLRSLADLWSGALVGRSVEIELWRVPAAAIPAGRAERIDWLYTLWERVDAWLEERARAGGASP